MIPYSLITAVLIAWPAQPYSIAVNSCAWVRAEPDGIGTGCIIDIQNRLLLTCRHVVGERKTVEVFFPWQRDGQLVTNRAEYLANREALSIVGLLVVGKVLKTSDETDLALIELPSLPPGTRAIPIAKTTSPIGSTISSIGNRSDLDTLWNLATGTLRQRGVLDDGYFWQRKKLAQKLLAILAQLPITEGDSGGPILNQTGELIGMVSATRSGPLNTIGPNSQAIRAFLNIAEPQAIPHNETSIADAVVWIRPTATQARLAGVLIDSQKRWVLTASNGLKPNQRVGVCFPLKNKSGELIAEREAYREPVALHRAGVWHVGRVLACDESRDLAMIQLDSLPKNALALLLAPRDAAIGDAVQSVSHPLGLDFAWVHSSGTLRQRGSIELTRDASKSVRSNLLQLPVQGNSAGGPVLTKRGEIIGVLSRKEGANLVAYAATLDEVRAFLAEVPGTVLRHCVQELLEECGTPTRFAGWCWFAKSMQWMDAKEKSFARDKALSLHRGCIPALLQRAEASFAGGETEAARRDCDSILAMDVQNRAALLFRAECWLMNNEDRKARSDLERVLEPNPAQALVQCRLGFALAQIGEEAQAIASFRNAVNFESKARVAVFRDALTHAEQLAKVNEARAAAWATRFLKALNHEAPTATDWPSLRNQMAKP